MYAVTATGALIDTDIVL